MRLPQEWSVLKTRSSETDRFLFGADYSEQQTEFSIYITNLSNVWICDVDSEKLKYQAMRCRVQFERLETLYDLLVAEFKSNFNGVAEGENPYEVSLDLDQLKFDRGVPLELNLKMEKRFLNTDFRWNWTFELTILPDTSSITILKYLIFRISTAVFTINEYKNDLIRQLKHKDSAIRFLKDTVESLNGSHIIEKWAPPKSANENVLSSFDDELFDQEWRKKKYPLLQNQNIWDVMDINRESGVWSYASSFRLQQNSSNDQQPRSLVPEESNISDTKMEESPSSARKSQNIDNLKEELEDYDINRDADDEGNRGSNASNTYQTPEPTEQPPSLKEASVDISTSGQSRAVSPDKKRKKTFGVSRKRKIQYKEYSPIKAPKYFHSDD